LARKWERERHSNKEIGGHSIVIQNSTLSGNSLSGGNFGSIRGGNFIHNVLKRGNEEDQEKVHIYSHFFYPEVEN